MEVRLAKGRGVALVDDEDAALVSGHRWYLHESGGLNYARSSSGGYMHRLLSGLVRGDGLEVDHRNGNGLDNRRGNMLVLTHAQNHQNRHRQAGRRSQYRGVVWWSTRGIWRTSVKVDGIVHSAGNYLDEHEAGRAVAVLRRQLMPYSTT